MKKIDKTPEQLSRIKIDEMLERSGWKVIDREQYETNQNALAVREGLLKGNLEADYLLILSNKVVGVLEAKRKEVDVNSDEVKQQAEKYIHNIPNTYQKISDIVPIIYLSNGEKTLFRDYSKDEEYTWVEKIETPKEIKERLQIKDEFAGLPTLKESGLRKCQFEAVNNLEQSFKEGNKRALISLATGAGKTFTACLIAYRMLSYTNSKHILFLVDRNNLGKQAEGEFANFRNTETKDAFNSIYEVKRITSNNLLTNANVVITTIQRLFSFLKGEEINNTEEDAIYTDDDTQITMPDNPTLPKDFFDLIIIDECHRSIYSSWQGVLTYFNKARLIGLTATPTEETLTFFGSNMVANYTLEQSIKDNVNVDGRIYRIKTEVTQNGGAIEVGDTTKQITNYTGKVKKVNFKEQKDYNPEELNRSIINPSQIQLILQTYKDKVYTEMFNDPQREFNMEYLPKTLIYALNDRHADMIVQIAKEVFKDEVKNNNSFVQKITYSSGDSNMLINSFRNEKNFRIAVTVTLVATGTDIKPLEVVMFMRDVQSETLYRQMFGRGVRTINKDALQRVTPNAITKDFFILVDCVGVTEHEHTIVKHTDKVDPTITLEKLLELLCHGNVQDEYLTMIQRRINAINKRCNDKQKEQFKKLACLSMQEISDSIYKTLENKTLPPYIDINEPNTERKQLVKPLTEHYPARQYLLELNKGYTYILQPGEDKLLSSGFSKEYASQTIQSFEKYINEHKDEIEALRIIYNNENIAITKTMLEDLQIRLKQENKEFTYSNLWYLYKLTDEKNIVKPLKDNEIIYLTNLIQLVRFAFHKINVLEGFSPYAKRRFNLWCGQKQNELTQEQKQIFKQIVDYVIQNSCITMDELRMANNPLSRDLITSFGDYDKANNALLYFNTFLTSNRQIA